MAILGHDLTVSDSHGQRIGKLQLAGIGASRPSVAPDAGCIAWVRPAPLSDSPVISIADGAQVRELPIPGRPPSDLAISSAARCIALVWRAGSGAGPRLISMDGATAQVEHDLTGATQPSSKEVERLSITSDGGRVAVGWRGSFAVIEVVSGRSLFRGDGRFATLSPDGSTLAFVGSGQQLVVRDLALGTERRPMRGRITQGVGSWTPDGRFLLAGSWVALSFQKRLVAVDTRDGGYLELARLGEGDYGDRCFWIARRLLAA